jgi:GTP pyrophosphokinase
LNAVVDQNLIDTLSRQIGWDEQLARAYDYAAGVGHVDKRRPRSIDVARRVCELGSDRDAVIATLLSDPGLRDLLDLKQIEAEFGATIARLTQGVNQLNTLKEAKPAQLNSPEQAQRRWVAQETLDIFAPLANRLGMGLLKWELEDLAFRALEPQAYKRIAKLLEEKRSEREAFIEKLRGRLQDLLAEQDIEANVQARVKHIVSIWRKMQRKNLEFHELFDVRAVRILVGSVADCYAVLGIVHTTWQHIPQEFDDYIANPKENGYQSLHTAVVADDGKIVEVQIRTREMHENSELGVASHWRYKEGARLDRRMESNIVDGVVQRARVRVYAERADHRYSAGRHAARFRLQHPFRGRPSLPRGQGQRPHRQPDHGPANRRRSGDTDH